MSKVVIIAEAGVNHNGDLDKAKALIDVAAESGADYVKFQTFKAEKLVSKSAIKADYQKRNINDGDDSQYAMLKRLELSEEHHSILKDYSQSRHIKFLSTAFDEESILFLNQLGIDLFKIPSGEITNYPYLVTIAKQLKPVILSTGMATYQEVEEAIKVLVNHGLSKDKLTVLHCNTEYPTPYGDVNLKAMTLMGQKLGTAFGYSDHTLGIEVPIAAVALGATVVEKHFTLDCTLPGPDHAASLEPEELRKMINAIRNIEMAISGSGQKEPSKSEVKNKLVVRKSIHIVKAIRAGEKIQQSHLGMRRPATGISPMELPNIIGRVTLRDLQEGEILLKTDFQ
ncbi:MAG: N-acetylneuraminate synthase [Cyclobacteriaceae bacterium]|jgi:N,N'-diacetyllegionaminate synthase|nr:N-acetylneuraminate synthase [Cytophagales bacterium]MCZ8327589.1 N-acetylneuraminate synthase [Cyclobacteriaceae bacterium]